MKKILHVSYSMDTGGGPLTIKRIVEDFPKYEYFVSGNAGFFMQYFSTVLPGNKLLYLKGMNLPLNLFLICKFCFKNKIDIVHVHGRGAASFSRFVKLFRPSTKIIYTPNGFFPDSLSPIKKRAYLLLERCLFKITDLVFFVSLSEQKTFAESIPGLNESKFIYIQNYLNPSQEYYNPFPYKHTTSAPVKFLFIGRLSPQKGIDILIEALKLTKSNSYHVVIVGYGSPI
jgi:glycosyltransferase involved in cell wall biosynthesis